jgi:hypothetical protein
MELTLEAYRIIVNYAGSRSDIAVLCRVSKTLRRVAERALYNTIYLQHPDEILALCSTLDASPRLASLVDAWTIAPARLGDADYSDEGDSEEDYDQELPEGFWETVAKALQNTTKLRFLNVHSQSASTSASASILRNTTFSLRRFHCDFDWDDDLVGFLNRQTEIVDLYILDFKPYLDPGSTTSTTAPTTFYSTSTNLHATAMSQLTTLECTFAEAADAIVPHRPITHLKTCFSKMEIAAKREEMIRLFSTISSSSQPIRSLDIADSSYNEPFAMELLRKVVDTKVTSSSLRYLGTLVLPIKGQEVRSWLISPTHPSH